ncbi:MAG: hypothetical protein WA137_08655 [Methanothrix sp.]
MKNIIVLALLLALCVPSLAQKANITEMPDMMGNWTGVMDSVGWEKNTAWMPNETVSYWPDGEEILTITEQNGNTFSGKIAPTQSPRSVEVVLGAMGSDNATINMVDENGIYWGDMISPTKMELFYQEVEIDEMVISVGIFEKMLT